MLTLIQLKEIAKQTGINPYYQEKDYMQNIFLYNLFRESRDFVFKGGTCLKIAYNYTRFSEDLDFNSKLGTEKIQNIVKRTLKSFQLLGINYEFLKEELFKDSYTAKVRFYGPFYTGSMESTNSIQMDIGKRNKVILEPRWIQINPLYPDIPKFFILAMDEREILAEKVRALAMRKEARDLFDLWSMINANVKIEKKLIDKKLVGREVKVEFCSRVEYERCLRNLLPVLPSYDQVISDVKKVLK